MADPKQSVNVSQSPKENREPTDAVIKKSANAAGDAQMPEEAPLETRGNAEDGNADAAKRPAVSSPHKKTRDEEEPAVPRYEPLGYDLEYPIHKKKKKKQKQKQINYAKRGSGKLVFHTYDGANPFRVRVNGKRFAYRRRNLPIGEIDVEVKTSFGIAKWYSFLLIFVDFFGMLIGRNPFGGSFRRQGVVEYSMRFSMTRRAAAKDVHVYLDREPSVDGFELKEIQSYTFRPVHRVQKRYENYSKYAVPVLFAPLLIALAVALICFYTM